MRILLVEDDGGLGDLVARGLRRAGIAVDLVAGLAQGAVSLDLVDYDCVVADRGLPDGDGIELLTRLREAGDDVPVLLLTARGSLHDRVTGFEHGADDYLVKPFELAELVVRVRALARRSHRPAAPVVDVGDLRVDRARRRVTRAGLLLPMTAKEFALLEVLALAAGQVMTRSQLIDRCWDEHTEPLSNVVDVTVGQLRRRLGPPDLIETVRGVGYRLEHPT